jgi:hypothetical protein
MTVVAGDGRGPVCPENDSTSWRRKAWPKFCLPRAEISGSGRHPTLARSESLFAVSNLVRKRECILEVLDDLAPLFC